MFGREKKNAPLAAAGVELRAIGVPVPTNVLEQRTILRTESNQITAAAMIWPEHQLLLAQLPEGLRDIVRAERGAIPPDRDDLVISESAERLDRVFEALSEIDPALAVEA